MRAMKETPIALKVQTEMFHENEKDEFFFDVTGQLVQMGNTLYIRYKEESADESVPVTVKIDPDGSVTIIRDAAERTRLKFVFQKQTEMPYKTPQGIFPITTYTTNLRISLKDEPYSGKLAIDYELYAGTQRLGSYFLRMEFTA